MKNINKKATFNIRFSIYLSVFCLLISLIFLNLANSENWTTYRYNNARTGVTPEKLTAPLSLQWEFKTVHSPKPAWPKPGEELPRMHFDSVYHVTVANNTVYFGSSVNNKIYAIDSESGETRWTFFTEGPIRFAPSIWEEKIYFGSDDGYVYCLQAKNGNLVWKYRPGPSDEKVIGTGRMISLWPIRTSVLVDNDVAYFGAGVFPYEGIYICALDADDGTVIWKNDTMGDKAHELAFGGISPQSYLVVSENILYVPSGRAMPAAFDRETGQFLRYLPAGHSGGTWALVSEGELIAGVDTSGGPTKTVFDNKTGRRKGYAYAWFPGLDMVVTHEVSYTLTKEGIKAISRGAYPHLTEKAGRIREDQKKLTSMLSDLKRKAEEVDEIMRKEIDKQIDETTKKINELANEEEENLKALACKWQYSRTGLSSLIVAGDVVFAGGKGIIVAVDANTGRELWNTKVNGTAYGIVASNGKLFVSTDEGYIYCFGKEEIPTKQIKPEIDSEPYPEDRLTSVYESAVENILEETEINKGYCLVLDAGTGRLAFEIAQNTGLTVVGIEEDLKKVEIAKEKLESAGLYGSQVVVENWNISSLPQYFANLIVSDATIAGKKASAWSEEMLRVLRPYGGVAYVADASSWTPGADDIYTEKTSSIDNVSMIIRGKLMDDGNWTEQYADPQNTACSDDELVKAPLGVLWFGEPGSEKIIDRHAKAMSPVAMNGRLFVQGQEVIMAIDAYNGTLLWKKEIPGAVRARVDVDAGNLSLTEDSLYVAAYDKCYKIDPVTGETIKVFEIPKTSDGSERRWGYVACYDNILYGTRAMPLRRDYLPFWDDNGNWKKADEIPEKFKSEYENLKARYPDAGNEMWESFKRFGYLWRTMANFPSWEIYNPSKNAVTSRIMVSDMVFAMQPETGDLLWQHEGEKIANITLSIGDGKLFFAECSVSEEQKKKALEHRKELIEKGIYEPTKWEAEFQDLDVRTIFCVDASTGEKEWEKTLDLTWCGGDALGTAYHEDGILLVFSDMGNHDAWRHQNGSLRWKRMTAISAENGDVLWSKPNNYRTRPFIVGDKVFIEPRVCDIHTGEIMTRTHPITGKQVPWEYLRPGHTCAITSASANMLFYRSYCAAFYDFEEDRGLTLFGGARPGCWINMIPASGVLLFPEGSAGCTCSFPIRSSMALVHKPQRNYPWNVFITHTVTHTAKHFAINLGAPGDMKDEEGNIWFAYPNTQTRYAGNHYPDYGVKFDLYEKVLEGMGYFCHDFRDVDIEGTDMPWLFTSGCIGLSRCDVPLIDEMWGDKPGVYSVQLGFVAPSGDDVGQRVFDVKIQGDVVLNDFDIVKEAGTTNKAVIKEFTDIKVKDFLTVEFVPKDDNPEMTQAPIVNFIKAVRQDVDTLTETPQTVQKMQESKAEELLETAKLELNRNNQEKALNIYHQVFDAAPSLELKKQALEGMEAIASQDSLSRIRQYCKNVHPILRDYIDPNPEIKNGAVKVCIAIANKIASSDKQKAIDMLNQTMKVVSKDSDIHQQITNSLEELGVEVENK